MATSLDQPSFSDQVESYMKLKGKDMDGSLMDEFKGVIETNITELKKRLTNNPTLDARLISTRFFDHADRQYIRDHGARENARKIQAINLVHVLLQGTNANVYALWKILKSDMDKPHVAVLLEVDGDPPPENGNPLEEPYRQQITTNQIDLQRLLPLGSGDFFSLLRRDKVVSSEQIDCDIKGTHKRTQNEEILDELLGGTNQRFVDFVDAIEKVGQPFIFSEYMRPYEMNEDVIDNNWAPQTQIQREEYPMDEYGNLDLC